MPGALLEALSQITGGASYGLLGNPGHERPPLLTISYQLSALSFTMLTRLTAICKYNRSILMSYRSLVVDCTPVQNLPKPIDNRRPVSYGLWYVTNGSCKPL